MTEGDSASVADRIHGRLDRMSLSAAEAARQAGLPADAIDRLLAGKARLPRGAKLRKLAEVLGCSVAYLVGLEPDAEPPAEVLEEDQGSLGPLLAPDQEALLRAYGRLDLASKQALLRVAQKMAGPAPEAPAEPPRPRSRRRKQA